jgi:hypothetical protein
MFIDYVTLMLINLAAGLALLAGYVYFGIGSSNQRRWIPGLGVVGAIALVTGLHMTLTWPIPGSFNIAFGEKTVLFGILFVGTSLTLAMGWELFTLGIYGFFAGLVSPCNWLSLYQPGVHTSCCASRNWVHYSWLRRNFFCTRPLSQREPTFANYWRNFVNCGSPHLCIYWINCLLGTSC